MPHRPVMLGIVGDSAAGKTTITAGIADLIGADRVTTVCVDDYHRYNRQQRKALGITALHPDCNFIDIMEQHLRCLAEGEPILKPNYNHRTGDFDAPTYVRPNKYVIIEGLLGFATQRLRDCFHVKVYLDPPEELRRAWKIKRDCARRGYTPEEVLAELDKREHDSATYIRPQKDFADLVVRFHPPEVPPLDEEHLAVRLTLRPTLPHPDLSRAVDLSSEALRLSVERENGRLAEFLEIDGHVDPGQAHAIEEAIWSQEPDLQRLLLQQVGQFTDGQVARRSRPLALSQLLIAYHLLLGRLAKERLAKELQKNGLLGTGT